MNRLLGIFLLVVAFAVAIHFVATPLYMPLDTTSYVYPFWDIMNWFMGVAMLIALWANTVQWRASNSADQCGSTCDCLLFGATIALTLMYFHNWFLSIRFNPPTDIELIWWAIIDAAFPVVVGATGLQLLKKKA